MDGAFQKDASEVRKTGAFDYPIRRKRNGEYTLTPDAGIVYTCFSSDFFLDRADEWRKEAWAMIRSRQDLHFLMITKRIDRFRVSLPEDWADGYEHVTIGTTVENQLMADFRLPIFRELPIRHKMIICEPLLGPIDLSSYLVDGLFEEVIAGGESGNRARICRYEWVTGLRQQCIDAGVAFGFKQTGARFWKEGRLYRIERRYQHSQARKSGLSYRP